MELGSKSIIQQARELELEMRTIEQPYAPIAISKPYQSISSYEEGLFYIRDSLLERDDLKIQVADLQQENQNLRNEIEALRRNQRLSSTQQYINSW